MAAEEESKGGGESTGLQQYKNYKNGKEWGLWFVPAFSRLTTRGAGAGKSVALFQDTGTP